MNEFIILATVGVIQIIVSIILIARKKNVIANITEVLSSFILLLILNSFSKDTYYISWIAIVLSAMEYVLMKVFLIGFIAIARLYSFYATKRLCKKKKQKVNFFKLKFIRTFNKVNYWPRLKLGIPGMADRRHPKTNVRFDSKGFPVFKSYYTVRLKRKNFQKTREQHFYIANKTLYNAVCSNSRLKSKFTAKEIKQFSLGQTPSRFTWHHHQDAGVLQLVDERIHAKTRHDGGYSIWGAK